MNYNLSCEVPLLRIGVKVDDQCQMLLISKEEQTGYMVSLPLLKGYYTNGYNGQVTSEIEGCEIRRTIKETFGSSTFYEVNGVDIKPKRRIEQVFRLESNGHLTLVSEEYFDSNVEYYKQ